MIDIFAATRQYKWWLPWCWNLGYGVPGGINGVCYG